MTHTKTNKSLITAADTPTDNQEGFLQASTSLHLRPLSMQFKKNQTKQNKKKTPNQQSGRCLQELHEFMLLALIGPRRGQTSAMLMVWNENITGWLQKFTATFLWWLNMSLKVC